MRPLRLDAEAQAGPVKCPKCGGLQTNVTYHADSMTMRSPGCGWSQHTHTPGEHLHYTCQTCKYDWTGPVKAEVKADDE